MLHHLLLFLEQIASYMLLPCKLTMHVYSYNWYIACVYIIIFLQSNYSNKVATMLEYAANYCVCVYVCVYV